MTECTDSFDTWCYNLSSNLSEFSGTKSRNDDFIPRYFQIELLPSIIDSNKLIFLPTEQDKLHIVLFLVKRFARELRRTGKYIACFVDSFERANRITSFLRKHVDLDVALLQRPLNVDASFPHFVVYSHDWVDSEVFIEKVASEALFVILDDCVHCLIEHPMRRVINTLLGTTIRPHFKILCMTSTLMYNDLHIQNLTTENMYEYFLRMQKTLESVMITSHNCSAVKKYLTSTKHKLVKYTSARGCTSEIEAAKIDRSLEYLYTLINKLSYDDARTMVVSKLRSIVDDFKEIFMRHGLFPTFVAARLSRIALEKLKLFCSDDSLFVVVSTMICEMNIISSWLKRAIEVSGCMEDVSIIRDCCDVKIMKAWSMLQRMDSKKKGVIFVNDTMTASVITYVFQKLCLLEDRTSVIESILTNNSDLVFGTTREELYRKKHCRRILKKFLRRSINVLVVTWKSLLNSSVADADWIFHFDLPPDYTTYIISQKYGNFVQNEHYFFVAHDEDDAKRKVEPFSILYNVLQDVLSKKDVTNEDNVMMSFISNEVTDKHLKGTCVPSTFQEVDLFSGINVVNRYCQSLPTDGFTRIAPIWTVEKENNDVTCKLQLPLEPSVRFTVQIKPVKNLETTKRVASLKTIQKLEELNHLDDRRLPRVNEVDPTLWREKSLFPLWRDEEDDYEADIFKRCRIVPITFPEWLYDCAPQSGVDCYVHVILMNPAYEVPDAPRKKFFHKLLKSREEFGFVTRKKLPDVSQFPVFADLGQVEISIRVNVSIQRFTEEQIEKLFSFHRFLFLNVLQVVKGFLVSDRSSKENSYIFVPLALDSNGTLQIAWDVVNNAYVKDIVKPSDEEIIHTDYIKKDYVGKIVSPWYRILPQRNYVVTKVLKDSSPSCPFTSDEYLSFTDYYSAKYNLEVKQPIQPLLEARAITMNLNCVRPRAKTPGIRRKRGEKEMDFDEILIPEFCVLQPFPAVYWYKSVMLLAIAHRLHYMLVAETIRQQVALYGQNSTLKSWPSDENDVLKTDVDCISEYEESSKVVVPVGSVLKDIKLAKTHRSYPWADERLPVDVDRNLKETCTLELMMQHDFMEKSNLLVDRYSSSENENHYRQNCMKPLKFYPRFLLLDRELCPGPKQSDIYEALTLVKCGDIVNLKLFKTIGRSLLKFATSLLLYRSYPDLNIVQLKRLRGKLIGKRNLFYCGSNVQLGSCLKLHDVDSDHDWNFGGFSVPQELLNVVIESGMPREVIFNLDIPRSEQASGVISSETRNLLHEKTLNYYNETTMEETNFLSTGTSAASDLNNHVLIYFKKQCVPDKAVVDVLEALTGVYLMNCGVETSFKFLQYMNVLKRDIDSQELFSTNVNSSAPKDSDDGTTTVNDLYHLIFVTRQYETKPLFAQVFTHHSCHPESSSACNRKLAFLGNALLDFLITGYIFEHRTPYMTVSDLEDVRVALVNDVLFAVILVRVGLHKQLSIQSPQLVEKIDKFVTQQQRVSHKINHDDYLFLVEETCDLVAEKETCDPAAEMIDVPKILSDTFKALMAAIFVELGDLKYVWNVCYNLMKNEIDTFMRDPPKNPVKLLSETNLLIGQPEKLECHKYGSNVHAVRLNVKIDNVSRSFIGVGEDKQRAKIIAAKLALRNLSKHFTL